MKLILENWRKFIKENSENLPISEFSPPGRPLSVYVVMPSEKIYQKISSLFSPDVFGHGFFIQNNDLIIIDGAIVDDNRYTEDHIRAIEAHEVGHAIAGHVGHGNIAQEIEADDIAIKLLLSRGYDKAAALLAQRVHNT